MEAALYSGLSPDAFLEWERKQGERHIYFRGEVFAMAGGSLRHSRLAARLTALFDRGLAGKSCDVHTSDLRLALGPEHFGYADVVLVCRPATLRPGTTDVVTNPRVVVEVLSKSTESYDRGDKQAAYLALASLEHFVLVSQKERRVEVYQRVPEGGFHFEVHGAGDTFRLGSLGVNISVDELYDGAFELPGDEG